jgi:hypothetical protein
MEDHIPLYLHIPKCGGSTVTQVIYQQCRSEQRDSVNNRYWHRGVYFYPAGLFSRPSRPSSTGVAENLGHSDLTCVVGHFSFGIHEFVARSCRYVTVLRKPLSRVISLYDELTAQNRIEMSLEEFVLEPPFPGVDNDQTRRIAGSEWHHRPADENLLKTATQNLESHFALVGITERMDETLCVLHRVFGWPDYHPCYPKNVTLKRTNREEVSQRVVRLIAERNTYDDLLYQFGEEQLNRAIHDQGPEFQDELAKYRDAVRELVEGVDADSIGSEKSRRMHQIVLDMIDNGTLR